jgi:hypothetical protein
MRCGIFKAELEGWVCEAPDIEAAAAGDASAARWSDDDMSFLSVNHPF